MSRMQFGALALVTLATFLQTELVTDLPPGFSSRQEAIRGGCRLVAVKGPSTDTCVLSTFGENQMDLVIYERADSRSYKAKHKIPITSWYWGAELSFVDLLGRTTNWLVIDTEGMRGTGIYQRVLFVIAWDGEHFRTVAAESQSYRCSRPTSSADYLLDVGYNFESGVNPALRLNYVLKEDDRTIGQWSDRLLWDQEKFTFVPDATTIKLSSPTVQAIRSKISHVREYSAGRPFNPGGDSLEWLAASDLLGVLVPACDR